MAFFRKQKYEIDMCDGPILPRILQFALPLALSTILQLLFNAADIVVVGRYAGDNALAAVGSTASLINLIVNLFVGLSGGTNILAARHFGAREEAKLRNTVHTSMLLALCSGILLTFVGVFGSRTILIWMNSPGDVLDLSALYLRIYFLGMVPTMCYNFGAALLRAKGDTQRPLYFLFAAGVINVILNLIFVIPLRMGVAGVAWATVISQCVSASLVVFSLLREQGPLHLDIHALKFHRYELRQIMQVGIPAGLQSVLFSLANVVVQSSVNLFGEAVISGNSAASNLENFVFAISSAFHQTNAAFTSQNYGAGNYPRIKKVYFRCIGCAFLLMQSCSFLLYLFGPQLLGIYSKTPSVIEAGMIRLAYVGLFYGLDCFMDVTVGSIRGIGYNVMPMIVSLLGACAFRLVWLSTVFQIPAFHRIESVYIVYPISWTITAATHMICFYITYQKLLRHSKI